MTITRGDLFFVIFIIGVIFIARIMIFGTKEKRIIKSKIASLEDRLRGIEANVAFLLTVIAAKCDCAQERLDKLSKESLLVKDVTEASGEIILEEFHLLLNELKFGNDDLRGLTTIVEDVLSQWNQQIAVDLRMGFRRSSFPARSVLKKELTKFSAQIRDKLLVEISELEKQIS